MTLVVSMLYTVSKKFTPWFSKNKFPKPPEIFKRNFTRPWYVHIYAILQNFIQLSLTLTKLYQIKGDRLVNVDILLEF